MVMVFTYILTNLVQLLVVADSQLSWRWRGLMRVFLLPRAGLPANSRTSAAKSAAAAFVNNLVVDEIAAVWLK
jgi:hypothetical protein